MDFLFLSFEQVCIALGAGSAFIFSSFFILSVKDHVITPYEYKMLRSLSLFSLISASIGIIAFIVNTALYLESHEDLRVGLISSKIIVFAFALLSAMTLRKIHLPALMRHQKTYFHLSDSMRHHPDPLVSTACFSLVSWIFIVMISTFEFRGVIGKVPISFIQIILSYIMITFVLSKIALFYKEKTLPR